MNANPQSLEDASNIVSEFIYSLDNLPNEVAHLLQEIKAKDARVHDLQIEIDRDSSRYIRHSLRASNAASSSSASPSPGPPRPPSPKSQLIPAKIEAAYAQIDALSTEKCAIAQRIIDLIARNRARLDADLAKVRVLQGDVAEPSFVALPSTPLVKAEIYSGSSRTPVSQVSESLRAALGASASVPDIRQTVPSTPSSSASASILVGPVQKKRRITAPTTSIKLAPVAATSPPRRSASPLTSNANANSHSNSHKRSRLSRQIDVTMDVVGEEEGEGEDENLYCFCQKQSYGDMIACDNDQCKYEWFHISCVQLTQPTPEKWYCRECVEKGFATSAGARKGRKR
ncbi:hypothetical protein C8R47DRAFT_1322555 [Mycena vitilis]|nr:hypothetical protein C8R47DRAFT_1322555 [Mycena vitilis]